MQLLDLKQILKGRGVRLFHKRWLIQKAVHQSLLT